MAPSRGDPLVQPPCQYLYWLSSINNEAGQSQSPQRFLGKALLQKTSSEPGIEQIRIQTYQRVCQVLTDLPDGRREFPQTFPRLQARKQAIVGPCLHILRQREKCLNGESFGWQPAFFPSTRQEATQGQGANVVASGDEDDPLEILEQRIRMGPPPPLFLASLGIGQQPQERSRVDGVWGVLPLLELEGMSGRDGLKEFQGPLASRRRGVFPCVGQR